MRSLSKEKYFYVNNMPHAETASSNSEGQYTVN